MSHSHCRWRPSGHESQSQECGVAMLINETIFGKLKIYFKRK